MNLPGVVTLIRFGCSIRLPHEGRFLFQDQFEADPQTFLRRWLKGAVSNIYTGPRVNPRDDHDGHLLIVPRVEVRYMKWNFARHAAGADTTDKTKERTEMNEQQNVQNSGLCAAAGQLNSDDILRHPNVPLARPGAGGRGRRRPMAVAVRCAATAISIGLALSLGAEGFAQEALTFHRTGPNSLEGQDPITDISLCELAVFLGVTALAASGAVMIYCEVRKKTEAPYMCICPARLILERNDGNLEGDHWTPVLTNDIPKICNTNRWMVFNMDWNGGGTNAGYFRIVVEPPPI